MRAVRAVLCCSGLTITFREDGTCIIETAGEDVKTQTVAWTLTDGALTVDGNPVTAELVDGRLSLTFASGTSMVLDRVEETTAEATQESK